MGRLFLAILGVLLFSCEETNFSTEVPLSDTAKILKQAISMGVDNNYMPSASGLKGRSHFGDTVLLTSQILPANILPHQIGSEKFKIMPQKDLCAALQPYENLEPLPHYLNIAQFEKKDSGYYIQLESISCGEFASGGALGIYFKKLKDSFVVTGRQGSSIN
jgi:hypothetical protein